MLVPACFPGLPVGAPPSQAPASCVRTLTPGISNGDLIWRLGLCSCGVDVSKEAGELPITQGWALLVYVCVLKLEMWT